MHTLTVMIMLISGYHIEKKFEYPTLSECQQEAASSKENAIKAFKGSAEVDVRVFCDGTEVKE